MNKSNNKINTEVNTEIVATNKEDEVVMSIKDTTCEKKDKATTKNKSKDNVVSFEQLKVKGFLSNLTPCKCQYINDQKMENKNVQFIPRIT
jgi:hypothetical protein